MLQNNKVIVFETVLFFRLPQENRGLVEGLIGEYEGAPMHGNGLLRSDVEMHLYRVVGIEVMVFHEPSRFISADGDGREVEGAEPVTDLFEMRAVA